MDIYNCSHLLLFENYRIALRTIVKLAVVGMQPNSLVEKYEAW